MPNNQMAFEQLRARYETPNTEGIDSYYFSLDGGGREIVIDFINHNNVKCLLEIGCFLNGSVLQWLNAKDDLVVVGVDSWVGDWHKTLARYTQSLPWLFKSISDPEAFIQSVQTHGPFISAMANVRRFENRFIPVRDRSPEVLPMLKEIGFTPDIVYIDAGKQRDDIDKAFELWPDALICGDDWNWGADQGYPIRQAVKGFTEEHGFSYHTERATWIINKEPVYRGQ